MVMVVSGRWCSWSRSREKWGTKRASELVQMRAPKKSKEMLCRSVSHGIFQ